MDSIELYTKLQNPIEAIDRLGEMFAKSGMFGCSRVEQGKVLAMICLAEQKSPVHILRTFHIIDGQLSKKALASLAEFRKAGGRHKWILDGNDGLKATGQFTFEGNTVEVSYSIEDAKRQNLSMKPGSNWAKTPSNMLRARVITNAIAMLCPEIFAGDDSDNEPQVAAPLTFAQPQEPRTVTATIVSTVPPVAPSDAVIEAEMGLAPAIPPTCEVPVKKASTRKALEPEVATVPEPPQEPMPAEPMKHAKSIGPEGEVPPPPKPVVKINPLIPPDQLSDTMIEQLGVVFAGKFLPVYQWMVQQGWIPPSPDEITAEFKAGQYLEQQLRFLTLKRANRVLTKPTAFMRAVETPQGEIML